VHGFDYLGVRIQFSALSQDFSNLQGVQSGSGTHPTSYPTGTGIVSPRIQRPERGAVYTLVSTIKIKKAHGSLHSAHVLTVRCLTKYKENFAHLYL